MKQLYALLFGFFLLVSFSSCGDDFGDRYGYNGDWNLVNVSGGFTGGGTAVIWDNINISGNNFSLFLGDELLLSADLDYGHFDEYGWQWVDFDFTYHRDLEGLLTFDYFATKLIYIDDYGVLTFSDGCCDTYSYHFERF